MTAATTTMNPKTWVPGGDDGAPPVQRALDFEGAQQRANLGIERAARKADKAQPGWGALAAGLLRSGAVILHAKGTVEFTVEAIRALVEGGAPEPTDKRAWGAATRSATHRGYIERIPGRYAPAESSNGSPKPMYRKGPNA